MKCDRLWRFWVTGNFNIPLAQSSKGLREIENMDLLGAVAEDELGVESSWGAGFLQSFESSHGKSHLVLVSQLHKPTLKLHEYYGRDLMPVSVVTRKHNNS